MRRYAFENLRNIRDLGGIPLPDDGYTRYGRFVRSEAPTVLTGAERGQILRLGIDTVVDLRNGHEAEASPNVLAGAEGIDYHLCPQKGGWDMPAREADIPATYLRIASGHDQVAPVLRLFARARGAVLFHCAAGKDRTGVYAALLLLIAGAQAEDIVADYEVSYIYRKDIIDAKHARHPEIPYFWSLSRPEYMLDFLRLFAARYGDVSCYSEAVGLTRADYLAIHDKLATR